MLNVMGQYAAAGRESSVWEEAHFRAALPQGQPFKGSHSATGLSIAISFPDLPARIEFTTEARHPQLGHGLLMLLVFPMTLPNELMRDVMRELVLDCNRAEPSLFRSHSVGSWCIGDEGLTYCAFVPNLASFAGGPFLSNMVFSMAQRAYSLAQSL
jgi:hypothetical protein